MSNMNQYMVEIALPDIYSEGFMNLIPAQRAKVNELFEQGNIRCYSLAADRSNLWIVFVAASVSEVEKMLDTFPIMPYCTHGVHELMFHDMATQELPRISLN